MTNQPTRRQVLAQAALIGCSLAASPLLTPLSLAATPGQNRLVVIILRGGMDGLDVVRPVGAPGFAALRPGLSDGGHDLDGFFAAHPALGDLMPLWRSGELGFVHAVSTPYRDKRSHFDGQDLLEAGTLDLGDRRGGWLNRVVQQVPGAHANMAFAVGQGGLRILDGPARVSDWSPDVALRLGPQARLLADMVMRDDPMFDAAWREAGRITDGFEARAAEAAPQHLQVARFTAAQLRADTRIAAFSLSGWDTHRNQKHTLRPALTRLSDVLLALRADLGDVWAQTTVVAMTEFGRTVVENGTGGTDHGTGGAMILAGGALRGGRVVGRWPGLAEADLYARRDLMPTADVRAPAAWVLRAIAGIGRSALETQVFPGLDMGEDPGLL
ncbi:MAG: DUF1501 domain-containing protein [Rhodobacteraceae bacterium]|nr:DUF1501 domain-containing protein [Paracoccaceae bacterium]